jgi:uncharacterized protein
MHVMNVGLRLIFAAAAAFALLPSGTTSASATTLKIGWNDLRPSADPAAAGEKLSLDLQGKTVEIAGYALPSDREGDLVYQFLLIPWTGLCAHIAPPPANQAVLINLKTPYKLREAYETVSVTGVLQPELEMTQLFILDGVSVIESGYRIAGAQVAPAEAISGGAPQPKANPWGFTRK